MGQGKATVIVLGAKGIELQGRQGEVLGRLDFTPEVVVAQEVVDRQKLLQLVGQMLGARGVKEVEIRLKDDVVYAKEVTLGQEGVEEAAKGVWDEVPIAPERMAKKILVRGDRVLVLAANGQLFEVVAEGVKSAGGKVTAIVAEAAMRFAGGNTLRGVGFGERERWVAGEKKGGWGGAGVGLISLLVVGAMVAGGWWWMRKKSPGQPAPVVVEEPTAAPTVTLVPIDKAKVNFRVVNATGLAGLAGRLRDLLAEEGFSEISVGTLDKSGLEMSEVRLAATVSADLREVIVVKLEGWLGEIEVREATEAADFAVVVTIAQEF